jgi:ubiquinone biosynthesis protein UbiJ
MLISTLENLLNRGLPRSPRARQLCTELSGRKVAVDIKGVMRLAISSVGDSLVVSRGSEAASVAPQTPSASGESVAGPATSGVAGPDAASVDAEIIGAPLALLQLAGSEPEAAIQRGEVQIHGDVEIAQKFRELALLLRPDIEEELALIIGDTPAHQLGRLARSAFGWGKRAADTTVRNVSEFLAHERGDLVSRPEGNQFLKGVDAAREAADRLEARFELIRQRAAARSTKQHGS